MARITLDIFSGRPNPSWVLDEKQARELLQDLQRRPEALAPADAFPGILGYRGLLVESEYEGARSAVAEFGRALPAAFRLGSGRARDNARSFEFAERLLAGMSEAAPLGGAEDAGPSYDKMNLRGLVQREMVNASTAREFTEAPTDAETYTALLADTSSAEDSGEFSTAAAAPPDETASAEFAAAAACWNPAAVIGSDVSSWVTQTVGSCQIEAGSFNPSFWNTGQAQRNNNCYNYASNRRTDTFAQPGRATCAGTSVMACNTVIAGAQSDGAILAPTCAASGAPRWYMALVVAPGYDYHWYRKASQGYWGHKPGSTAAKNTDNSGNVIYDPQTANRGPYTDFCGYFFAQAGMGVRVAQTRRG